MKRSRHSGFTLLEILVVLAIIGLLVGLTVSSSEKLFSSSQTAVAKIFVRDSLKTSLVRYRVDLGDYPSTAEGIQALLSPPPSKSDRWQGPYLDAPGNRLPVDPWGEPYQYRYRGTKNPSGYDLFSKGPDKVEGTEDDLGNW